MLIAARIVRTDPVGAGGGCSPLGGFTSG